MKTFENFKALQKHSEQLAKELLSERMGGEWQNDEIHYFTDKNEFAKYEVFEGWYSLSNKLNDFNGAPNLFEFIDYSALSDELIRLWDESTNFISDNGQVLTTSYGW
ncbi:hypothetical protein QOK74_08320 [Staphylococcus saprophyticus]|uniref:hypothetical protein n=1 Tax=Staphylococcus saprophyticus TaxID=29385 RepID=UPI0024C29038|nr:hypothetical protein [Staphylococcus saprophyticus]MDK1672876.1 hypothetical protein [Staphylococcus saprophyticus]